MESGQVASGPLEYSYIILKEGEVWAVMPDRASAEDYIRDAELVDPDDYEILMMRLGRRHPKPVWVWEGVWNGGLVQAAKAWVWDYHPKVQMGDFWLLRNSCESYSDFLAWAKKVMTE